VEATHLFAGLAVSDYETSLRWWEWLLGRGPDMLPTDGEAVWAIGNGASLYIAQRSSAGRGLVALAVADLDALLVDLRGRGVDVPSVESGGGAPPRVVLTDPDGNELTLFEDLGRA
jgi:hypothetical protein